MDIDSLTNQAITATYWLISIGLPAAIVKSPWFKGFLGEALVRIFDWLLLPLRVYQRVHNVTLQPPDGTTQIDHIFASRFGIFVVETKNM